MRKIKAELVPIDSITISRELHTNDDISPLIDDIRRFPGLKFPVVIDKESRLLLDGLRRVRAMEALGYKEVTALALDMFEEVCEMQAKVQAHGVAQRPLTPLRIYQFYTDTETLRRERTTRARRRDWKDRKAGPDQRDYMMQALAPTREAEMVASISLYKKFTAEIEDPVLQGFYADVRHKLEAGEMTIFQARIRVVDPDPTKLVGEIVNANDQRQMLTTAINQFSGTNLGLRELGELHPDINPIELRAYLQGFERERSKLQHLIRTLRKRVNVS